MDELFVLLSRPDTQLVHKISFFVAYPKILLWYLLFSPISSVSPSTISLLSACKYAFFSLKVKSLFSHITFHLCLISIHSLSKTPWESYLHSVVWHCPYHFIKAAHQGHSALWVSKYDCNFSAFRLPDPSLALERVDYSLLCAALFYFIYFLNFLYFAAKKLHSSFSSCHVCWLFSVSFVGYSSFPQSLNIGVHRTQSSDCLSPLSAI